MDLVSQPRFLSKIASFTKIALDEISVLEGEVNTLRKAASMRDYEDMEKQAVLKVALDSAAEALYNSDFITDDIERRKFMKMAQEDPAYLANMITKVCRAADVSFIGKPAHAVSNINKYAKYSSEDPVAARAFGLGSNSALSFDE